MYGFSVEGVSDMEGSTKLSISVEVDMEEREGRYARYFPSGRTQTYYRLSLAPHRRKYVCVRRLSEMPIRAEITQTYDL